MLTIRIRKGRARPLWGHHPWVYSGAIQSLSDEVPPGEPVEIEDASGQFIGRGYCNPHSTIAARILTWDQQEAIDAAFFRRRISRAVEVRRALGLPEIATGYRLIHSEGDLLSGVVVDRYADYLVVQIGTAGMERLKEPLLQALQEELSPAGILGRSPAAFAELERFKPVEGLLAGAAPDGPVIIEEHGIRFQVDLVGGQKTGFYFDQRENRRRVAELASGRSLLDCFCYSGAFSMYSAIPGRARRVVAIDSSPVAIDLLGRNLSLNGDPAVTAIQGDVGSVLQEMLQGDQRFDLVVLDPPKLVQSVRHLEKGLTAYRRLNTLAMRILARPGLLVSCSCSGVVDEALFERMLGESALAAGREVRIVERRSQGVDHPVSPSCPESRYLKCYLCHVG
ncbi:MAG: class I SAM-dependent rRNA methyltransferase [Bradymonadales bacterium]|nr:class I SAM-dependent rRNA methyltransferase [Bradymonadales bacterium]